MPDTKNEKSKILIVEDNALNRDILIEQVERDYDVVIASTDQEALSILENDRESFSLAMVDVFRPAINAFNFLRTMRVNGWLEEIPVVVLSLDGQEDIGEKAYLAGASDYIISNYDLDFLNKRIRNCIALSSRERAEIIRINQEADLLKNELWDNLTAESILESLKRLNDLYDSVRLVDVSEMIEYTLQENNHLIRSTNHCFDLWDKDGRCENCISSRAFKEKSRHSKYEFIGDDVYLAVAKYVEIDQVPFVLELVSKVDDEIFLDAVGKEHLMESILNQNSQLYEDALTGAYNRYYYEEQLKHLQVSAIAMIDLDRFKAVNDNFGHLAGDTVLRETAQKIKSMIRSTDALIRFGGDEFLIVFVGIQENVLKKKLDSIRKAIEEYRFADYPETHITLSIGAVVTDSCDDAIIDEADKKLYLAKQKRNCVVL